ncbi:MAG: hypothetical protein JXR48_05250 [Candidatus Delongbacteria bacterium]|nr:hypothetical protein [Candidatus Delongbacteria bacterium]MBN2834355.1 hypothetical protein [Candidatus Delongbacteria bacterium]
MKSKLFNLIILIMISAFPLFSYSNEEEIVIEFEGKDLHFYNKDYDDEIILKKDLRLYINDFEITTNEKTSEYLSDFYKRTEFIYDEVENLKDDGIDIGLDGGALGISAIAGVFKMLLPDYDSDDFERDIEIEAEKIESKAKVLEKRGQRLEKAVNRLENDLEKLKEIIPELNELKWL